MRYARSVRPTVLLFDIDGTLISTGGAGRRAMERGFDAVHGRRDAVSFRMDGMTDRLIARQGLEAIGVTATAAAIDAVLEAYVAALGEEPLLGEQVIEVPRCGERGRIALGGIGEDGPVELDRLDGARPDVESDHRLASGEEHYAAFPSIAGTGAPGSRQGP